MSKVKIQGNAAGTANFTIAAPATNTDRTITLPDVDATVMTSAGGNFTQNIGIAFDGYPALKFRNAAGTDKAEIYVGTGVGDLNVVVNAQSAISVDSSARIRMPYQPSFDAYGTIGNYSVTSEATPPLSATNFNVGSHYNTSNGRFTAPVAGKYFFRFHTYKQTTAHLSRVRINKNGVVSVYHIVPNSTQETITLSAIINLAIGDYVYPQLQADGATDFYLADNHTNFSGYLIG